jgi:hypothetical protein
MKRRGSAGAGRVRLVLLGGGRAEQLQRRSRDRARRPRRLPLPCLRAWACTGVRAGGLAIRQPCVAAHAPDVRLGAPAHGAWLCPSSLAGWARCTVKMVRRRPHGAGGSTTDTPRRPYAGARCVQRVPRGTVWVGRALEQEDVHVISFEPLQKHKTRNFQNKVENVRK